MKPLRAVARRLDSDCFEAQLLELDIAVAARSVDDLIKEIEYALLLEYQIAHERGKTPFLNILHKTPRAFTTWWMPDAKTTTRKLNLPANVLEALALAIRSTETPAFEVQEYRIAA